MKQLSFGTTFYHHRGHIPGAQLAAKLAEITPDGIDQFFYALGGCDAVETAIKLARYVNAVNGRPEKHHIIGRVRSYHGVTYGAMSLAGDPLMVDELRSPARGVLPHRAAPQRRDRRGPGARGRDPAHRRRQGRRVHGRADLDPERHQGPARRLLARGPGDLRPPRRPADLRRGADGIRADGPDVRDRQLGRPPGHDGAVQGDHRRLLPAVGGRNDQRDRRSPERRQRTSSAMG